LHQSAFLVIFSSPFKRTALTHHRDPHVLAIRKFNDHRTVRLVQTKGVVSMKLDSIFHALMPKDDKFHGYFEDAAENLLQAAKIFRELMSNAISKEERAQKIKKIEELEHNGDEITHTIYSELGSTFVTPFDREDIHMLASKLDDILDFVQGAATRIVLYRVDTIPPEQERLASLIYDSVFELHRAIPKLRDLKSVESIRESLVKINSIENDADDLFERAIANLFDNCKDPILLIKTKELFVSLETATDKCEDAANVIESIIVKNA
jgi:predicted phosphate transport protein (TIGR00153 family)